VNPTHHRSTAVRWAALAAKVVAGAAAGALIVLVALVAYAVNDVGDPFSPVRMSGPVGDSSLREEYEYSHLVTAAQIATIHPRMPGNDALRILGGRSQQIPVTTRINHRWLRTGTCYAYPIAGTGHLYDGLTVADEAELCLSYPRHGRTQRQVIVTSITRTPWRTVRKRLTGVPSSVPTMKGSQGSRTFCTFGAGGRSCE
jgi:hypothetical protein